MLEHTLYGLLNSIRNGELVLPAMQRPFVWKEDRLYRLMDSLLRGFPIGAVMLWKTTTAQRYRIFPQDIDDTVDQIFTFETSSLNSNKYLVLDGQQRLTGLYCMFMGTYNNKILHLDILSGDSEDKDPGNEYYECRFLTEQEAKDINCKQKNVHFLSVRELLKINPVYAAKDAHDKAKELQLNDEDASKVANVYIRSSNIFGARSLQVITVDEDQQHITPLEEILEIFVRINSGGLVLQKSDLLMSLLDLTWNDIQPKLQGMVKEINKVNLLKITRDDVLKSLLLAEGAETRFDRLVNDRDRVKDLSKKLPLHISGITNSWKMMLCILKDRCKIYSERFLKGGHNSLLPFVIYIHKNPTLSDSEKRKLTFAVYVTLISGIFSGAEARMNSFVRKLIKTSNSTFPLESLLKLVKTKYGFTSLDSLMRYSLDLSLNLAHGGISVDNNPENLQRDHIFPRSKRLAENIPEDKVNHYANFHFLRGVDNLNKSDTEPDIWFKNPGKEIPPYSDADLAERLLTWDDIKPGNFLNMIEKRGQKIRNKACEIFGYTESEINELLK